MKNKWKVKEVDVAKIEKTEVNANHMGKRDFDKLCQNISKSGLSSMIACYLRKDGKYVIISGNHRYRACVKLGYSKLNILYADEKDLTKDEIIAVQLSHNSLHGEDDKGILKRLFAEINNIEWKEVAHINVDTLDVDDMFSGSIISVSEHYRVGLVLYRKDMELLDELLDIVKEENRTADLVILADGKKNEDKFIDALSVVKTEYEIKSSSIAFSKILDLAKIGMLTNLTENDKKE
ncbi:ParB N-terminal domain-containing protein [candidate division WWE3 bacterium]|jgi:hypothetical protein|nr:ParB N-terminal domain-containing protein [candidate division WWE3 bacterium]